MADKMPWEEDYGLTAPAPAEQQTAQPMPWDEDYSQPHTGAPVADHPDETKAEPWAEQYAAPAPNPDHAGVNEMLRKAVDSGATADQVMEIARANGVPNYQNLAGNIAAAVKWRKQHGNYAGYVEAFGDAAADVKPQVRKTARNEVSTLDGFGQGLKQGLTLNHSDEMGAGIDAAANSVANLFGAGNGQDFGDFYMDARDQRRELAADAEEQHPWAYNGGQIVGAVAPALAGGAGASLLGRAAIEGGIIGLGQSEATDAGTVARDAAVGAAVGGLSAGALNRLGAVISPRVAPLVQKLMGQGIDLTPAAVLRAGGPVARTLGKGVDMVARRGAIAGEVMRGAEQRSLDSVDAAVARQDAAVAAARAMGLNATPRHPDLLNEAQSLIGKPKGQASNLDLIANVLLGMKTGGTSVAGDLGMASLYTGPGAKIANRLLTGNQGPVPKAVRGITTKLSPLAGNAAAINTQYEDQ
jgi:hypothetical protein